MKKTLLFIIPAILLTFSTSAQYFLGLRASNYGGITNVSYNPAIADSRFHVDINLIAVGFTFNNNYLGISRSKLFSPTSIDGNNFQYDSTFKERLNGNPKKVYIGTQVQGPLSFMFGFGKKNRNALAFSWHVNSITNLDGIGEPLARMAYFGLGGPAEQYFKQQFQNQNLSINSMAWADYGITYSRVVIDEPKHMLKVGGTVKLLQGLGAAYLQSKNIAYKFSSNDTLSIYNSDLSYGHSNNFGVGDGANNFSWDFNHAKPTVGFDLAAVYEFRPNKEKFAYQMDGDKWYRKDQNLYMVQVGFSIIDLGAVNYVRDTNSQNFHADTRDWYIKNFGASEGVKSFDDTILTHNGFTRASNNTLLKVWLPTRINIWVDVQVGKGFGFNAAAMLNPVIAGEKNQVHHISTFNITPHYDHTWFGAYLPFSYDAMGNANLGLTLRMGPLIIGTQDLLGLFAKKYVYNADIHVALKIPIPYGRPKDRDHDGVSNKKDKCPKIPGPWETRGCPDKDGDGVTDDKDKCPDVPGPKELDGCPDTDGDGIIDMNDSCPTVKGPVQFNGCPDSDSDGIPDKLDKCPLQAGLPEFEGCPDRDKDGVPDKDDLCPDIAGAKEHHGCPDTDGDGVYDNDDKCINVAGPAENAGCPWPDSDGDGVPDKDDQCPFTKGLAENHGCPVLAKKEIATIKMAFDNLEFETGKDIIRTKSYPSLNALAELLKGKPGSGLRIDGHTDNVGTPEKNLLLSEKRAVAVKNYLVKKGVDPGALETHGYGMTKPIADNKTKEGRQKNRRVEMNMTFK